MSHHAVTTIIVSLAFTGIAVGCSSSAKPAASPDSTTSTTSAAPATVSPQSTKGGGQSGGGGTTAPAPRGPAPTITSFVTPDNIDCHNGNSQTFTASWTTNGAKVTISIDGPGIYKTYDPSGSDSLPFNCSASHSFLLTAYGQDGQTSTKTITLDPRNAQSTTTST